ncbi:unnamed protein product [Paramecium octaurelia]|uniref:Uncharacterized protein n=1 Tax=Paramecium octaurelia TaxID=43137 RepID=A0A8S1U4R0_PAROT|nr:unnamed protein product [Paramecium octaurelia]
MQSPQYLIEIIRQKDQEIQNLKKELEILRMGKQVAKEQAKINIEAAYVIQESQKDKMLLELQAQNIKLKKASQQQQQNMISLQKQLNEYQNLISKQNEQQNNEELKTMPIYRTIYQSIQQSQEI